MYYFEMEQKPGLMKGGLNLSTINKEEMGMLSKTKNVIVHILQPRVVDNKIVREFSSIRLIVGKDLGQYAEIENYGKKYFPKYRNNEQVLVCSANDEIVRNLVKIHNMTGDDQISFNKFYSEMLQDSAFKI